MPMLTGLTQTFFNEAIHQRLVIQLRPYFSDISNAFFGLIENKNYNLAFQHICRDSSETANRILAILLQFKEELNIHLNEQVGEEQQSALHHVAIKQNRYGYQLLLQAGIDAGLIDAEGKTAIAYFLFEPLYGYRR